ncbi:probable mitochondrial import inner membrane translocase subunit TIM21 [Impatiens glandulifera]|uniref:probable mitochondrial import inner membrane translocase subunit TIM21 n=1 Tax=Impatiens glandulifera TaxID=253017 RepID=UPI001FB19227|nr:probable mitochondrial import inner membrane translocase subunit TIM21 [Impatiens glandulifera]
MLRRCSDKTAAYLFRVSNTQKKFNIRGQEDSSFFIPRIHSNVSAAVHPAKISIETSLSTKTKGLLGGKQIRESITRLQLSSQICRNRVADISYPLSFRTFASQASGKQRRDPSQTKKEVSKVEDPFDAPTYHIPEKPVSFTEGASYSLIILAGLGVAAAAGYAVFKELIFQPKEYKIFDKALERIQNDSQVRVRIGHPITGYGQESRNRAARQRIPNKIWTDEEGVEHVEVNFYIRGPSGAGKVYTEMFKDKADKQWKFTFLVVEITSPSRAQLMLESYMPA